jgi:shikimate kinase
LSGHVYLIGFMGAGKTTVGRIAAERLGRPFVDLDALIEQEEGRSVRRVFEDDGEEAFRRMERRALESIAMDDTPSVVGCGGGIVLDPGNRERMRETGTVVYLSTTAEAVRRRVRTGGARPLMPEGTQEIERLLHSRLPAYEAAAHIAIETSERSLDAVTEAVVEAVRKT